MGRQLLAQGLCPGTVASSPPSSPVYRIPVIGPRPSNGFFDVHLFPNRNARYNSQTSFPRLCGPCRFAGGLGALFPLHARRRTPNLCGPVGLSSLTMVNRNLLRQFDNIDDEAELHKIFEDEGLGGIESWL